MTYAIPRYMGMLYTKSRDVLFVDDFFEVKKSPNRGVDIRLVKPVLKFPRGEVSLGYNVGTRTNGVDQPRWPEDLMTEVVVGKGGSWSL
jgi:hypothetical protein